MGNLAQYTPSESPIVTAIYDWHKRMGDAEPARGYLGASIIGHECNRYLWYCFRGCVDRAFSGRMYRLFETGDLAEDRFIRELRGIGCTVVDRDDATGEQWAVESCGGHFRGHADSIVLGVPGAEKTWHLAEFKTHCAKSFAALVKNGVKRAKGQHYAQMQVYMGLLKLTRALYLAANKDTDELYAERIEFNADDFRRTMERAQWIVQAQEPPPRGYDRADFYACRFCEARDLCWGFTDTRAVPIPRKSCRTCCHATPEMTGGAGWSCARFHDVGEGGCDEHLILPGLVSFADPVDAGDGWIEFRNHDGARWTHGNLPGQWKTEDLITTRGPLDQSFAPSYDPADDLPLPQRYPWKDSELLFHGSPDAVERELANLGLEPLATAEPDSTECTDDYTACEFKHEGIAIVTYASDGSTAIWKGKE